MYLWCKANLPRDTWEFSLIYDLDSGEDLTTYSFSDPDVAVQFDLMFGDGSDPATG